MPHASLLMLSKTNLKIIKSFRNEDGTNSHTLEQIKGIQLLGLTVYCILSRKWLLKTQTVRWQQQVVARICQMYPGN